MKKQKRLWHVGPFLAVLAIFVNSSLGINAEFTDVDAGLFELYGSSVSWGDYDNDGDLDLALAGGWLTDSQNEMARIYRNDGNDLFTNIGPSGADGANNGSLDWGDHNNDGLLDLAVSGYAGGGHFWLRIYQNEDNDAFTKLTGGFAPVEGHSLAWGDYDNDGDQDLAITGGWWNRQNVPGTKIYRNDGAGVYTDIGAAVADVSSSALAWGDYDKDGDLDLVLAGSSASGRVSTIYRNDGGGIFSDISAGLTPVNGADLDWGDYDNDGDLDLALAGTSDSGIVSTIYQNNGGVFVDISAGLMPLTSGDISWGDYDNDGDLDLIQAGSDGVDAHTILYRNGGGVFTDTEAPLADMSGGSIAWGDYDADGDLDLALSGSTAGGSVSKIYRNDSLVSNTAPAAPGGLSASVSGDNSLTFSWNSATDTETPSAGLSYNLRVGTSPGGSDVFAGMADASTGLRRIAETGNAQKNLSWSLDGLDLEQSTYYWGVQAIDTAFAGSAWASGIIPEPATLGVLLIGGLALLRGRRRFGG